MTTKDDRQIRDEDWATIVRNVPIASVDLVVRHGAGLLLGKRTNEPAMGAWFVPGGTVFKHESLEEAVHRIARTEIGSDVRIERQLGVYEHRYETADVTGADGKHYVVVAYLVTTLDDRFTSDEQHEELRTFPLPAAPGEFHPYVMAYLHDIDAVADG